MKLLVIMKYIVIFVYIFINVADAYEYTGTNATLQNNLNDEYKITDKKLNKTYKKLIRFFNLSKEEKNDLRKAQRAWIKYRDAECHFQSYPMRGGTGEYTMELSCLIELTEIRTKILGATMKE